jgi:hypothetical protein
MHLRMSESYFPLKLTYIPTNYFWEKTTEGEQGNFSLLIFTLSLTFSFISSLLHLYVPIYFVC